MSKTTNRDAAPGDTGPVERRLARVLDTPVLARVVPHLPAATLHQLIRYRGLDACGELVTSATPAQLAALLDLDLWRRARPGRDERFDVDRFGEWLEVLVDTGDAVAARTIAAVDKDVVIAGLSRYIRVFDPGIFEPTAQSDDEPIERVEAMRVGDAMAAGPGRDRDAGDGWLECEVAGYVVRARRADAWDAIVALLIALEAGHDGYFRAVMHGCRALSNSRPEVDGLHDLLMVPEQQLHDLAIAREQRRSHQGYATPADARAFLRMARQPRHTGPAAVSPGAIAANPIVTAYFRAADDQPDGPSEHVPATGVPNSVVDVIELLTEAGMIPGGPRPSTLLGPAPRAVEGRAMLEAVDADRQSARLERFRQLMTHAGDTDESAYLTRSRALAFLANTLLAGCSVQSRPFTPQEASEAAAGICNLGLEHWPAHWPSVAAQSARPSDSLLIDHSLVTAFEVGWSVLHREVTLFAADQLIATLNDLHGFDRDITVGVVALRRALVRQREAGTPWRARDAADVLAMLDPTVWVGVLGLLDECPILPAALTAVLERRTTPVSAAQFAFFSTSAQIDDVRGFLRRLPELLSP